MTGTVTYVSLPTGQPGEAAPVETTPRSRVDRALTLGGVGRGIDGELSSVTRQIYAGQAKRANVWRRSELKLTDDTWTPEDLALYAEALIAQGYARATAELAVRSVRWYARVHGRPSPDGLPALYVLRGSDTTAGDDEPVNDLVSRASRHSGELLAAMASAVDIDNPVKADRDLALVALAYAAGVGNATACELNVGDLRALPNDSGWSIDLPGGRREVVEHDQAEHDLGVCPACRVGLWFNRLTAAGTGDSEALPLFRSVDKAGNIGGAGVRKGGRVTDATGRLTSRSVTRELRRLAVRAGLVDAVESPTRLLRLVGAVDAFRAGRIHLAGAAARAGYKPDSPVLARLLLGYTS
ncbi:hypothetical protein [Micromonospora sp. NPDC049645]|uniref:hypothetical protein n=1 Tax=Micromonospora sp. NPDC049645 TaxID=3155508 RepID=UPI00344972F2